MFNIDITKWLKPIQDLKLIMMIDKEDNLFAEVTWRPEDEDVVKKLATLILLLEDGAMRGVILEAISRKDKMTATNVKTIISQLEPNQAGDPNSLVVDPTQVLDVRRFVKDESEMEQ